MVTLHGRKYKRRKRLYIMLASLLFAAALWLAGLHSFTRDMQLSEPGDVDQADAIVVLTGGSNRLKTGFELLEQHRGQKLFISGVYHGVDVRELMNQSKSQSHDDLDCCVVLGFDADDTLGNARETVAWMQQENYKSIILVTANYHVKRALIAFDLYGGDRITIKPYAVAPDGLDMANWWRNPTYRSLVLREYSKYLASFSLYLLPGKFL